MLEEEILEEIEKENPNEIIEITDDTENNTVYDMNNVNEKTPKENKKKDKKPNKIKEKWNELSKNQKIIIIVISVIVLLVIIGLLLYFLVFKKDEASKSKEETPIKIVEKDNYRYENGKLIFIDQNKNELGSYECQNKDENLCFVSYYSDEDNFDITKYVYEDNKVLENRSDIFLDKYVFIYDNKNKENGTINLYNIKTNESLGEYKLVKEVNDEMVILKDKKDNYGAIKFTDEDQENVISFKYDYLGYILNSDKIVAMDDLSYYLLNMEGDKETKAIPGEIKNFNDKYISVIVDKSYYIYDYNGKQARDTEYDYITFKDAYTFVIDNKKLFLFDNDMNALNVEGIKLSSNEYNTKIIFDENKMQIDKKEAFNITINSDNINIEYDEESKLINIYEGKLSAKQENISYFDGILYIYSDSEKNDLVGSYTCENKNVIDSSTSEYNNCTIAKENALLNRDTNNTKVGYLPVYNKRYVFVQDSPNVRNEETIILWDLKQKKKQATYTEVDAGFYNDSKSIKFIDTANTLVMAKNTSGSYGIIRIENSALTGIISFKEGNDSIKYLNNNFLVKRKDGSYHLFDIKGKELASSDNEIVDYKNNYVQVKDGSHYVVYNNGKIINTSKSLVYIKMYDKFFVGIASDDTIDAYSYDGKSLINDANGTNIIINKDNYDRAYEINTEGTTYRLAILNSDGKTYYNSYLLNFGD